VLNCHWDATSFILVGIILHKFRVIFFFAQFYDDYYSHDRKDT
jgi:hypothetical protein